MKPLREFIEKHRAAAVIIAAAVAVFAVWEVYAVVNAGGPAATTSVDQPAARPTPAAAGAGGPSRAGPAGSAAMRAAGHLTGAPVPALPGAPSSGASTGAPPAGSTAAAPAGVRAPAVASTAPAASGPPPSTGRSDPFAPLVTPGGGSPASINPTLPPVPPLAPGSFGPSASNGAGPALPGLPGTPGTHGQFQLTGIVVGPSAVAILNDGAGSYIVEPGDTVTPGVRVVAIDAQNQTVTLTSKDQSWQLRLKGGTSR